MSDSEVKVTVNKTVEVNMDAVLALTYLRNPTVGTTPFEGGYPRVECAYGEYHDGRLHRLLAHQDAPPEHADPAIAFMQSAMDAAVVQSKEKIQTLPPEEWGPNEHYVYGLMQEGDSGE